ncbi:hypothetical protein RIR_jg8394.t1 [Rhizophagus irregularis DAOM 181602=DAOM 197198]|nr:hypothetical protein RIR_jg8394.t1 [Rhizophagus irregularis DAOM 181602=DAOM 197198]
MEFWPLLYTRIQETSFEVRTWIAFQNFLKLQQEVVIHNNIIRLYGIMKDECENQLHLCYRNPREEWLPTFETSLINVINRVRGYIEKFSFIYRLE